MLQVGLRACRYVVVMLLFAIGANPCLAGTYSDDELIVSVGSLESMWFLGQDVRLGVLVENRGAAPRSIRVSARSRDDLKCLVERVVAQRQPDVDVVLQVEISVDPNSAEIIYAPLLGGGWALECLDAGSAYEFVTQVVVASEGTLISEVIRTPVVAPVSDVGLELLESYRRRSEQRMYIDWYSLERLADGIPGNTELLAELMAGAEYSSAFRLGPLSGADVATWKRRVRAEAESTAADTGSINTPQALDKKLLSPRECLLECAKTAQRADTSAQDGMSACVQDASDVLRHLSSLLVDELETTR